ncbi:MAG: hypothetical protein AB1673_05905 [Actinomycetota bacterium]
MSRGPQITVVGGGPASPEQVAAMAAALAVVLDGAGAGARPPAPSPWRWAGRTWSRPGADWRDRAGAAHPSRP